MAGTTFKTVNHQAEVLFNKEDFRGVIELYESYWQEFPHNQYEMTWECALAEGMAGKPALALERLGKGMKEQAFFYPLLPYAELFRTAETAPDWQELSQKNNLLREAAQQSASIHLTFHSGEDSDSEGFFLALHGWGENIEFFQERWHSEKLNHRFDTLYLQSSQITDYKGFGWDDPEIARQNINKALSRLDRSGRPLFAGGFSQGATTLLSLTMSKDQKGIPFPPEGLILLCPSRPSNWNVPQLSRWSRQSLERPGASRPRRLWIMTGEEDSNLAEQREMITEARQAGIPCQLTINKGLGHWFPSNLDKQLDEALDYITGRITLEEG